MSELDYEQLTLFQEDFPASLFPWLESKKVKTTTVICGRKCSELSESLRRVGSLVRTYLESCELRDKTLSRTWSVRAMTSSCLILKLRLSVRGTGGNASPLWATPNTMDGMGQRSYEAMMRQATLGGRKNRKRPGNLREQVDPLMCQAYKEASLRANGLLPHDTKENHLSQKVQLLPQMDEETMLFWSTPTMRGYKGSNSMEHLKQEGNHHQKQLANQVKLWSTPTTGAGLCGGTGNFQQLQKLKENGTITEEERRQMSQGNGGQLNPDWVEWLMGFPIGWTSLPESQE